MKRRKTPQRDFRKLLMTMYNAYPAHYAGPLEHELPEDFRDHLHKQSIIIKSTAKHPDGKQLYTLGPTGIILAQSYLQQANAYTNHRIMHQARTTTMLLSILIVVTLVLAYLLLIIPLS